MKDWMRTYSEMEGEQIVRLARAVIELSIKSRNLDLDILREPLNSYGAPNGVFVTLCHYPGGDIRSRMGIHKMGRSMGELVVNAAIGAAFKDPKMVPVSLNEIGHIVVGIDILSDFEEIRSSGKGKLIKVKLGRDGLYIKYGFKSAVLLPSFSEENSLNKIGFFEAACGAIGIQKDLWMQPNVKISKFETQSFAEEEPDGRVREVKRQE